MRIRWPGAGVPIAALVSAAVGALALAPASALPAPVHSDAATVSFSGAAMGGQLITGTFSLDRFEVKTPLNYSAFGGYRPQPQLVAVGTVTGNTSSYTPGSGVTVVPFEHAPFVWVNLTVAARCGDAATVTFEPITGLDYLGIGPIYGQPLWDPTVPAPVWNSDVHWGVDAANPVVLTGNPGLPCAIAQAVSHDNLRVEATTLNALLR